MGLFGDSGASNGTDDQDDKIYEFENPLLRKLYSLFNALETSWPGFAVSIGAVVEIIQLFALLFNKHFTWGEIIQIFSIGVHSFLLPFWDSTYVISASFIVTAVLVMLLLAALVVLFVILIAELRKMDTRQELVFPRFTKLLLYLLTGPLFLPSLHLLLATTVCTGGHGSSTGNYLAEFTEELCFKKDYPWMILVFCASIFTMFFLVLAKICLTMLIYEDCPTSESLRARPHCIVEGWVMVHSFLFSVLYHYLPAIGQREVFVALLSAGSFFIAALHVFYMPFYANLMNRIRVIGYACLTFTSFVMTIGLVVGPSSPIYAATNMDVAVIVPGCLVVAIIGFALALLRVSPQHRRDIARARHGEIRPDKFVRRMFYPYYLPQVEVHRFHSNRYVLDARNNVVVPDPGPGSASMSGKNSMHTAGTSTLLNSSVFQNLHREVEEMTKFEMTCYIDSVYVCTDVELATRFLISFTRVTNTTAPDHLLEYAISIYNKGLNRFVRNSWLELQFAIFLCCYVTRTNHVSLALCEDLQHRELGPLLSYRLFRCSSSISDQRIRRNQAARQQLQHAMKIHKETLISMQLFWKRMVNERVDVEILGEASMTIIGGCNRGAGYYKAAIDQRTDGVILSRYAQFLEDVVLAPEAAEYTREIAADMCIKQEQGIAMEDLKNDKIISSRQKLGERYGRISRNLRFFLIIMALIMLALLITFLAIVLSTYVSSTRVLNSLYSAAGFRFYAFRCMWLAEAAMNATDTSVLWNMLEGDLTQLRDLFQDLTYGKYKALDGSEREIMQGSYYSIIYGKNIYLLENAGVWRAAEVIIDALETLVLYRSSTDSRNMAYTLLRGNELSGAASAFNASLVGYQNKANDDFSTAIIIIGVLYFVMIALLFVTFFMFRYYLTRITGMGMMALSLFRLIPKNSLETMVVYLEEKISHFDEPDALLQQMVRERKKAGYLGAELSEVPQDASQSSSMSIIPTMAPMGLGPGGPGAGEGGHHGGQGHRKVSDETATGGSRFANLALNASVADVGRVKYHVGEYEPPYPKGAFPPRVLSEDEARARQDDINDIEVEATLTKIRQHKETNKTVAGEQLDEGSTYFAPVSIDGSNDVFHRKLTMFLSVLITGVSIAIGVLSIMLLTIIRDNHDTSVPLLHEMNIFEQQTYQYFSALEGFALLGSMKKGVVMSDLEFAEVQTALTSLTTQASNFAVAQLYFNQRSSTERSPGFTVEMQKFNYYSTVVIDQLLASSKLACSAALPTTGAPLDCSFFQAYNYATELFLPNQTEDVVFDRNLKLPTDWETDSALDAPARAELAVNVMASAYYSSLYTSTTTAWQNVRQTITQGGSGSDLVHSVKRSKVLKGFSFGLSIALLLLLIGLCVQTGRYAKDSLIFLCALVTAVLGGLVLAANVFFLLSTVPMDGPYSNCVSVLTFTSSIFSLQMQSLENMKQGAFVNTWLGTVNFATVTGQQLFSSWNSLFELLGADYLEDLTNSYAGLQYSFFITTIILRLAVVYQQYTPLDVFTSLPIIKSCEWNMEAETIGFRRVLMYEGTSQQLYTTTAKDLALAPEAQISLAYSLAFGPLRTGSFQQGVTDMNTAVKNYVADQLKISTNRFQIQQPFLITGIVLVLLIAFINIIIIFFLITYILQMYHSRKGSRGKSSVMYDRGFAGIIRWTSVLNIFFFAMLTVVGILVVVHYFNLLNTFRRLNIVNLREVQLMTSDIAMSKGVNYPWYVAVGMFLAEGAVHSSDEYYRTAHLQFYKDIPPLLFGGVNNISYVRYNKELALDQNVKPFQEQNPILAFEDYVDPSTRNWRQRMLEMTTMTATNRYNQNAFLQTPLYNLTQLSFDSTTAIQKDFQADRVKWVVIQLVVFFLTFILFLVTLWYMIVPVVRRLRQEEEGTQVVLQMIPPHIRTAIPAIYQYMKTGGVAQDSNAVEIDQISKDLSVVPIITINTQGKIRQFSRAAEESFLWTRTEAIGQNVNILMPDNIAVMHDRYLQNYLKTGVKTMIGNSRPIRAKRKDGTVFSAVLEVSEFHTGSELMFVGAVHVSQEVIELERSAQLSKGLTDSSTIPIVVCDIDGVIQSFSKSAAEVFKYKEEEIVGQKVNMLMPKADAEMHDAYIERYIRTGQGNLIDKARLMRGKRMNGELFPIRLSVREFKVAGRTLFVAYIEDLTIRLRLEMVAAAGGVMQERCPVPLLVTDMEGRIVQCSQSLMTVCGIQPTEVMGKDIRYLVKDESVMDLVEKVKNNPRGILAHIDDFHVVECTVQRRNEDGTDGIFQARITTRLFTWHTKGAHLMLFIQDLTNLQQLQLSSRIGNMVMALSAVPIVVVNGRGAIEQMSAAAETMFHCFIGEAYGKSVDILFETEESMMRGSRMNSPSNGADEDDSVASSDAGLSFKNPIARVVEEYIKSGTTSLCGRYLKGVGRATEYGSTFPVEVLVKEVDQGEERLFLAYVRDTRDDHRLLEVTRWNDAFMSLTPIPIVCSDLEGTIFACSDSACARFKWAREDLIGSNVNVLMPPRFASEHPKHMMQYRENLEAAYKEGERKSILNRSALFIGRAQDGEEFPVTVSLRDVHIEGADSFIVAALRPSQQDMELEALGKVGATMSAISPCPFICINSYGIVTEFSRSAQESFGFAEHEVVGQNVNILQTPDVAAHHDGYLRAYQKTGIKRVIDQTVPVVARKKDGTLMNVELSVKEVRHKGSLEFIGYVHDVTGKQTTKQMTKLDELVELEAASPMLELDGRGNIVDVRCLEHDFGYVRSDLLGRSILTIIPHNYKKADEETWIQNVMKELMSADKKRGDSMASLSVNHQDRANGGQEMNWVSRRLYAKHKNGEEFFCDIVIGEVVQAVEPLNGQNRNTNNKKKGQKSQQDMHMVMYIRNLHKEVLLELTHGINTTATELFPCPLITLTTDGVITLFNRAAEESFAYTAKEAVGKSLLAFIVPSEAQRLRSALDQLRAPSSDAFNETTLEDLHIRRKGSSGPVGMALSLQRLTDVNHKAYLLGTFRDPLSDQAAENEETLSNVLMAFSPVPIIVTDHRGMIEQFSSGAETYLGYTQLDVEGKGVGMVKARLASLDHRGESRGGGRRGGGGDKYSEDFFRVSMSYTEGMQLPVSIREKIIIRTKENREVFADVHIHSIMPYKKKVPRFIAYMQDTTDHITNKDATDKYNRLFNNALSGVLVVGTHGVILDSNPTAQRVLGYTAAELLEAPVSQVMTGDNRQSSKLLRGISHVMETSAQNGDASIAAVQVHDAEMTCKGGSRVAVDAIVATILASSGKEMIRIAINFIDVASEKKTKLCQQREEFLESVSGMISIELDQNGNFLQVSDTFLDLLEYEEDEVIGHSWSSFVPKGDQQLGHSIAMALNICEQGLEMHPEYLILTFVAKSGMSIKMEGDLKSVVRSDGSFCSLFGCLKLVQLRDSQMTQLAIAAMDVTDASLVLCTVDGAILSTNTTTQKIFEIPSDTSVIGQRISMFFPPEAVKESIERFQRLIIDGQSEIVRGLTFKQTMDGGAVVNRNSTNADQSMSLQDSAGSPKFAKANTGPSTFALEVRVIPLKANDELNKSMNSSPNGSHLAGGKSVVNGTKSQRRSSLTSTQIDGASRRERNSTLLLVRMRRVNEKHQLLLMRAAMEAAMSLNTFGTFTMDDTGVIKSWSQTAHNMFFLPTPIGRNVLDVLFDQASSQILKSNLQRFRKIRSLGELERMQLTAFFYKTGRDVAGSPPVGSISTNNKGRQSGSISEQLLNGSASPMSPTGPALPSVTPAGVQLAEVLFREAKNESGALVTGDLLCYVKIIAKGRGRQSEIR